MIRLRGVRHRYQEASSGRDVLALDGVDLDVAEGETVALIGPSGCGKSTLLHLVAGMFPPSAGELSCGGQPVRGVGTDRVLVFQDGALFPWMTVADNIAFGARGASPSPWIRELGLEGAERRWPRELSGGMRQRVALARALAARPTVLLLDEPFGALDALAREQMWELLASTRARHPCTTLLVTHSVDEALALADRVVVLGPRPARVELLLPVPPAEGRPAARREVLARLTGR